MAGVLQHLRSSTLDKRPNPASMVDGQVAINYASGAPGMFFKDSNGSLVKVGPVHVGTTAPNVSPASGGTAGNSRGEQWLDTTGGTYVFKIWDGSAWRSESGTFVDTSGDTMTGALGIIAGSASTPGLFFSGDTNTGIYSPGADQLAISTGGSGRLFVDASGNVGVGVAPNAKLQVGDGTGAALYVDLSTNNYYRAYEHIFQGQGGSSERLRITSAGLVGVGTSSPGSLLHVAGQIYSSGTGYTGTNSPTLRLINSTATTGRTFGINSTDGGAFQVFDASAGDATRIWLDSSGRVGIGTTSPATTLHTVGTVRISRSDDAAQYLNLYASAGEGFIDAVNSNSGANQPIIFRSGNNSATTERARIDSSGRLLVGTSSDSGGALLQINGDRIRIATAKTPASATDTGTAGEICWDASYIYVCTATNTWKRTAIATW